MCPVDTGRGAGHGRERGQAGRARGSSGSTCRPARMASDGRSGSAGSRTEREARRALAQAKVDIDAGRLRYGPGGRWPTWRPSGWRRSRRTGRRRRSATTGWLMRAYVVPRSGAAGSTASRQRMSRSCTRAARPRAVGRAAAVGHPGSQHPPGAAQRPRLRRCASATSLATPRTAIDKPREDTEERTVYTPDEVRRFLLRR